MKRIILEELKISMLNMRMAIGIIVIVCVSLLSGIDMFREMSGLGVSTEGPGWYVAYRYSIYMFNVLLIIPLVVTWPSSENLESEIHSRYCMFNCSRTSKKAYIVSKITSLVVSGGVMVLCSFIILLLVSVLSFKNINFTNIENISLVKIYGCTLMSLPIGFLNGAFWSVVGSMSAVVTKNKYSSHTIPFVLYYVLTIFQERYYRNMYILSPRYWCDPKIYGESKCILILLALIGITTIIFSNAIKRRLKNV